MSAPAESERFFTLDEARQAMPTVLEIASELIPCRAALAAATHGQRTGAPTMALADLKGLEAQLGELTDRLQRLGVQIKGVAPLLVDFPMHHDGRVVLLCWLEGDPELAWYHDAELGFAGRRPLTDLDPDADQR